MVTAYSPIGGHIPAQVGAARSLAPSLPSMRSSVGGPLLAFRPASENTELERLFGAPGREMAMMSGVYEREIRPQRVRKGRRIIAHDWKPAAPFRTVKIKGRDDRVTVNRECLVHTGEVGGAVGILDQEMECRAVVPYIVPVFRCRPGRDVGDDPINACGLFAKSCLRDGKRRCRQVKSGDIAISALQEMIDEV